MQGHSRRATPGIRAVQLLMLGEAIWAAAAILVQSDAGGSASSARLPQLTAYGASLAIWAGLVIKLGSVSRAARMWIGVTFLASGGLAVALVVQGRNIPSDLLALGLMLVVLFLLYVERGTAQAFRKEVQVAGSSAAGSALAPAWLRQLALPKSVRSSAEARPEELVQNRLGRMTGRQRWLFSWVGVPILALGLLFVFTGVFGSSPQTANSPPRALVVGVGILLGVLFIVGGLPAALEGMFGRAVTTTGALSAQRGERPRKGAKTRLVLVDGALTAVPTQAHAAMLAATSGVRIHRSLVLGRFLSWEAEEGDRAVPRATP
jgi:hypothetical protein